MRKRIVAMLLFDAFRNDSRVHKEAMSLARNDWDVSVYCLHESGLKLRESKYGYQVERIRLLFCENRQNKAIQACRYLEFYLRATFFCRPAAVVHCHDLNTLAGGVLAKAFSLGRVKLIYDAHEYETETNWLNGTRKQVSKLLERFLILWVDSVITVSDSIASAYEQAYRIEKPTVILNVPSFSDVVAKAKWRSELGIGESTVLFIYQGGLSPGRGIENLLIAFSTMSLNAAIVFMGYGELKAAILDAANKSDSIFFYPAVDVEEILSYTAAADFGVSLIEDTCLSYRYSLPNKVFEYAMSMVPPIVANLPEMAKIVTEGNIGLVSDDYSPDAIKRVVVNAIKLGKQKFLGSLMEFKKKFNWENQERILLTLYQMVLNKE